MTDGTKSVWPNATAEPTRQNATMDESSGTTESPEHARHRSDDKLTDRSDGKPEDQSDGQVGDQDRRYDQVDGRDTTDAETNVNPKHDTSH